MRRIYAGLLVCAMAATAAAQGSDLTITNPKDAQAVDYLVVADDAFVAACTPLLRHRQSVGLRPGVLPMSTLREHFDDVRAALRHALDTWDPAPRFVLLVGDVDRVPAVIRDGEFTQPPGERDLATDFEYACPRTALQPEVHVGRFPCDTVDECATMVGKTVTYETSGQVGAWQHQVAFVTGEAGFSPQLDRMIEQLFIQIVAPGIPGAFRIELAYANPRSPFCPDPTRFNAHSLKLLNAGALFYVYVGHGYRNGVDRLRVGERIYRVLDTPDAPKIAVAKGQGLPVMVVIACSTGQYDHAGDCVGEAFFKQPRGPVAFLGGSRVTQPYFNGLFGKALVDHVFTAPTLGEAFTAAKQQVLAHKPSQLTQQADFMASMMQGGAQALPGMRRDGVRHYNLLGDPALRLQLPAQDLQVMLEGDEVTIVGPVPRLRLTLEVDRGRFTEPMPRVDPAAADAGDQLAARYKLANDPVLMAWDCTLVSDATCQKITLPTTPGVYWLKARAPGHVGALRFEVAKPAPPADEDDDF